MRILGLDIGSKRIGVAVSDEKEIISIPVEVFNNDGKAGKNLKRLINKYSIKKIVVGLPYTLKGEIGSQAKNIMAMAESLLNDLEIEVDYVDERYTTKIPLKISNRRPADTEIDKFSASIILSDYLKRRNRKIEDIK